jgi:hypothetical protein
MEELGGGTTNGTFCGCFAFVGMMEVVGDARSSSLQGWSRVEYRYTRSPLYAVVFVTSISNRARLRRKKLTKEHLLIRISAAALKGANK